MTDLLRLMAGQLGDESLGFAVEVFIKYYRRHPISDDDVISGGKFAIALLSCVIEDRPFSEVIDQDGRLVSFAIGASPTDVTHDDE